MIYKRLDEFITELNEQRALLCLYGEDDIVIVVCGSEGSGKTTFSIALSSVDPLFYEQNQIYYTWLDYIMVQLDALNKMDGKTGMTNIQPGSVLLYDEAGTQLAARAAMSAGNIDQIKLFQSNRFLRLIHILNIPKLGSLDKYVREQRLRIFIWVDAAYDNKTGRKSRNAYVWGRSSMWKIFSKFDWEKLFNNVNMLLSKCEPDYMIHIPNLKEGDIVPKDFWNKYMDKKIAFNRQQMEDMIKKATNKPRRRRKKDE